MCAASTAMKFQLNIFNCPSTPIDSLLWFTVSYSVCWIKTISKKNHMLIERNMIQRYTCTWMYNWQRAMKHTIDKIIIIITIELNWTFNTTKIWTCYNINAFNSTTINVVAVEWISQIDILLQYIACWTQYEASVSLTL